jgi:hypothetical protein
MEERAAVLNALPSEFPLDEASPPEGDEHRQEGAGAVHQAQQGIDAAEFAAGVGDLFDAADAFDGGDEGGAERMYAEVPARVGATSATEEGGSARVEAEKEAEEEGEDEEEEE